MGCVGVSREALALCGEVVLGSKPGGSRIRRRWRWQSAISGQPNRCLWPLPVSETIQHGLSVLERREHRLEGHALTDEHLPHGFVVGTEGFEPRCGWHKA